MPKSNVLKPLFKAHRINLSISRLKHNLAENSIDKIQLNSYWVLIKHSTQIELLNNFK